MNIIQADPRSLIPYELNNRKHPEQQINRIANSISEFGFNQPIIVDEQNIVLVGHGRLAAALKLGLDKVPVLQVLGLTEAKKKAYRILDNKLQNDSEWDFNNLELELAHLEDLGFELEPWGLDEFTSKFGVEVQGTPESEWQGMPLYESEDEEAFRTLKIHFMSAEHVEDFSRLLNQQITEKTKSLWFPEQIKRDLQKIRVINES